MTRGAFFSVLVALFLTSLLAGWSVGRLTSKDYDKDVGAVHEYLLPHVQPDGPGHYIAESSKGRLDLIWDSVLAIRVAGFEHRFNAQSGNLGSPDTSTIEPAGALARLRDKENILDLAAIFVGGVEARSVGKTADRFSEDFKSASGRGRAALAAAAVLFVSTGFGLGYTAGYEEAPPWHHEAIQKKLENSDFWRALAKKYYSQKAARLTLSIDESGKCECQDFLRGSAPLLYPSENYERELSAFNGFRQADVRILGPKTSVVLIHYNYVGASRYPFVIRSAESSVTLADGRVIEGAMASLNEIDKLSDPELSRRARKGEFALPSYQPTPDHFIAVRFPLSADEFATRRSIRLTIQGHLDDQWQFAERPPASLRIPSKEEVEAREREHRNEEEFLRKRELFFTPSSDSDLDFSRPARARSGRSPSTQRPDGSVKIRIP